jgi:hypothetical protein
MAAAIRGGELMTDGFESARAQRNVLERLGEKIPGYRGFQDRELRRDVDKRQREHLAHELEAIKGKLRSRARAYTDAGRIEPLSRFERLDRGLEGLSQAVRFSDYGASGLFDVEKIGEAQLEKLYQFDLEVLEDIEALARDVAAIPAPGGEDPTAALDGALCDLEELADRWAGREVVVSSVVKR